MQTVFCIIKKKLQHPLLTRASVCDWLAAALHKQVGMQELCRIVNMKASNDSNFKEFANSHADGYNYFFWNFKFSEQFNENCRIASKQI